MFFVYVLQSIVDGSFYKGHTSDLSQRIVWHNSKKVKSTAKYVPWNLIWYCTKSNKKEAVELELKLKNLTRNRLIKLMMKYPAKKVDGCPEITIISPYGNTGKYC
ncbi:MAG: GIY-YIG nuclease family protein [Bacteroidetes bacterium]|nr:GIY-YIG nuclease family protein [Bacteroidota bacterium]